MASVAVIEQRFKAFEDVIYVKLSMDGKYHQLTVVSDRFDGQSKVVRQQWVYAQLSDYITSGEIHALSMNTWTNAEWEKQHG